MAGGSQIEQFIRNEVFLPRIRRKGVLVVYDPARRYRDICLSLGAEGPQIVDCSESSIESRAAASSALSNWGNNGQPTGLVIYVPSRKPLTDEDKQGDPFSVYAELGTVFPDGSGDEYEQLCLKAKPDQATQIRAIFQQDPEPSFAVVDAVGGGLDWPMLRGLLKAESSRDILLTLLVPNDSDLEALKEHDGWASEARKLFTATLGLKLKTRAKGWSGIADELWRFLLFSEFAFDLPGPLPDSLADVPRAPPPARPLVQDLCERLRSDQRTHVTYIDRAEGIEQELGLPTLCADVDDLGERDTFPFEERKFLLKAVDALINDDWDQVRRIIQNHAQSVWTGKGESQAQWGLIEAALALVEVSDDLERQLPGHSGSQGALLDFYLVGLREADQRQREFEQAVGDHLDIEGALADVVDRARSRYRRLAEKVQVVFTRHLESSGWPPSNRLANADVFDEMVAPGLRESGRRVAYFLVDALRYELGVALQQQLAEDDTFELVPAYAQLPSITLIGMASLLPEAGKKLRLAKKEGSKDELGFVPMLEDTPVTSVPQRMEIFRRRLGDRFTEMPLNGFLRSKKALPETINLLVLRSFDIDSQLESNPETTLGLIHDTLKRIRAAVHKLKKLGFHEVVIATDHGFFLNGHAEAGDVCTKPPGRWVTVHERTLLGDGTADAHNFVIGAEKLGIRGDFSQAAGPRTMAPYRSGMLYFHGGASLQEAVVPVLVGKLKAAEQPAVQTAGVALSYKNGAKRITTRLPVLDVELESADIFSQDKDFEILLEAHDKKNEVVGEAKPGGPVNAATGTVTLRPGERLQVTLKMQLEFEGKFKVKALDPKTLTAYATLDLETDYAV